MNKLYALLIILLIILLASCTPNNTQSKLDSNQTNEDRQPASQPVSKHVSVLETSSPTIALPTPTLSSLPTIQTSIIPEFSKFTADDFAIEASFLSREEKDVSVNICFRAPTQDDWSTMGAYLIIEDNQRISADSGIPSAMQPFSDDPSAGYRCVDTHFTVPIEQDISDAKIIIDGMIMIPREGNSCGLFLDEVKPALAAQQIPIEFECVTDHGPNITIISRPDTMTDHEALNVLFDYFTVRHTWEIEVE